MVGNSFWLIYIQDNSVSVSLVSSNDQNFQILGTGPGVEWDTNIEESLSKAIDESLSIASINANITEEQEPELAAFVIPPFWVGSDSKITPLKLKIIKDACKKLALQPTGYLAEDDAIVEDNNSVDGFPASFILLHLSQKEFYLSLVYLGHIKQRVTKFFDGEFSGQLVEEALLELNSESALPPQIIVFGKADTQTVSLLKDFSWVGKKNIETFLHFPDIKFLTTQEIIGIFSQVISLQMNPGVKKNQMIGDFSPSDSSENLIEEKTLIEADPEVLGFSNSDNLSVPTTNPSIETTFQEDVQSTPEIFPEPNLDPFEPPVMPSFPNINKNKKIIFSFNFLKKIKLPNWNLKFNNLFWIFLILLPFIVFFALFIVKSQIIFFMNPYEFNKSIPVTLEVDTDNSLISKFIIPVEKKPFEVISTAKVTATGQKTIGEKSTGEIIIFNKVDKVQTIPKGSVLVDSTGKKFELVNAVSVASSSSNLEQGVINLGQTKTAAIAVDIGSEYNINTGTSLIFSDYPETILIAKANNTFTGGNRQQILAISQQDKIDIQTKLNQQINVDIESKIAADFNNLPGSLKDTIQTKKSNLELNREVGESAEELIGTVNSSVSVFIISDETKKMIISSYLSSEPDFDKIDIDSNNFQLSFKPTKLESEKATGTLIVTGSSLPKLDINNIKKNLTLKTVKQADSIIKKLVPRANRFKITNKFFLMPIRTENIDIQVKLEKL